MIIKVLALISSFFLQYLVAGDVIGRTVDNWSLLNWMLSILLFYTFFPFSSAKKDSYAKKDNIFQKFRIRFSLPAFLIIIFALLIRAYLMFDLSNFHYDEYLTAHFSYSLGNISNIDWFGVYPEKGVWVSQFPTFFFFLQKLFLNLFGINTLAFRFAVLPYVFVTFLFTFLVCKHLFNKKSAYISIVLLAFLAPDIYLTRMGLHFISSTALFLVALYLFIKAVREGEKWQFGLLGMFMGFCYMTYYSSYLIVPILFILFILLFIQKKIEYKQLKYFLLSIGIFLLTFGPLAVYANKVENFFLQRSSQVSVFSGEWSHYADDNLTFEKFYEILKPQMTKSVRSLYQDDIGGHGGYDFGHLSLFDWLTFISFFISILYFLFKGLFKIQTQHLIVLVIIFASFVVGMVFTIPPPAYHRFSLAFPFIAMAIAVTGERFFQLSLRSIGKPAVLIFMIALLSVLLSNVSHFSNMLENDKNRNSEFIQLERDIRAQEERNIYISAFNSYALGKYLLFRFEGERNFFTGNLGNLTREIEKDQPFLLILHYPERETLETVKRNFPQAQTINEYPTHHLFKIK